MTRNSRELSQFASFIDIKDANQNIGLQTSMVFETGGVGIGSDVSGYLLEAQSRGAEDPLIVYNKSFFLDDVEIEGDITIDGGDSGSISGAGATFPKLNVSGLTTTNDLVVTGIATLGRDSGMGVIYAGMEAVSVSFINTRMLNFHGGVGTYRSKDYGVAGVGVTVSNEQADSEIVQAALVIDASPIRTPAGVGTAPGGNEIGLIVHGRSHFHGYDDYDNQVGPHFVVATRSLFTDEMDVYNNLIVSKSADADDARLLVYNSEHLAEESVGFGITGYDAAIYTDGGIEAQANARVGYALSIGEAIYVGGQLDPGSGDLRDLNHNGDRVTSTFFGDVEFKGVEVSFGSTLGNGQQLQLSNARIDNIYPQGNGVHNIGTEFSRWTQFFGVGADFFGDDSQVNMVNLDVGLGATVAYLDVAGNGGADTEEVYLTVAPGKTILANLEALSTNFVGITTIVGQLIVNGIEGSISEAYITTARRAENVDVWKQDSTNSVDPEFFYPAMANAGISQTDAGAQMFVNPGFYLDTFSTSLYVHNNLNVLGTAINADQSDPELRFDIVNYGVKYLNIASQAEFIDIGQDNITGMTSIRSNVTEVKRLQLAEDFIQASTGSTNITLEDDIKTKFSGYVQIGGTYIQVDSNVINIADQSQNCDLFTKGVDILVGGASVGVITFRNTITETGFLRLRENTIYSDDDIVAIEVGSAGTYVSASGELIVGAKKILTGFGVTNIEMVDDTKTILYGDLLIKGNNIQSSDGAVAITISDAQEQTSITGALRVESDHIRAGTGATNIYMNDLNFTRFAGAIQVDGDAIRSSNGLDNITLDSDVKTTVSGDLQVGTGTMRAGDGIIAIKMVEGTGDVGITSDLTCNSLFANGLNAGLNVQDLDIRDNLITMGNIEDPLVKGSLIPPNVAAGNTGDVGILLARYDVGINTHKYAGVFYDQSAGRIAIATDVSDPNDGAIGRDRSLLINGQPSVLELGNLLININSTLGIKTIFEANTIDTGEEENVEVLNIVNVEIDGGIYA